MKHLFFTAILAIVAISGALTSKAGKIYFNAANVSYDCTGTGALCKTAIAPVQTLWTQPNQTGAAVISSTLDNTNKLK